MQSGRGARWQGRGVRVYLCGVTGSRMQWQTCAEGGLAWTSRFAKYPLGCSTHSVRDSGGRNDYCAGG